MRKNYTSLQYLRAAAALLVVVAHTTEYPFGAGSAVPFWTARMSALGVETFFVISGFIIITVSGPDRFDPIRFAWRRFIRVAPLYWIATTALFCLACFAPHLFKTTAADGQDFLKSLLFVPYAQPGQGPNHWSPLLKPGWTLNVEVFFYALTAALFWCRRFRVVGLTLLLGTLVVLSFRDTSGLGVLDFYARKDLLAFLGGAWLAVANRHAGATSAQSGRLLAITGTGSILAVLGVFGMPDERLGAGLAIPAAILIVSAAMLVERSGRLPSWPLLRRIGDASYSLYLTHMFTVGLLWSLLAKVTNPLAMPAHVSGTALATACAILVAFASYRLIEQPFLKLARTGEPSRPTDRPTIRSGSVAPETTAVPARAIQA